MKQHSAPHHCVLAPLKFALTLSALVCAGCGSASTEKLGDFALPAISGWERTKRDSQKSPAIKYEKKENGNRLYIGLTYKPGRVGNPPKTVADLQAEVAKGFHGTASLMNGIGTTMQIQSKPTTALSLNGLTAVETLALMKTRKNTTYGKTINFVNGSNYYILQANITVPLNASPSAPPALQAEMDKALAQVTSALKP